MAYDVTFGTAVHDKPTSSFCPLVAVNPVGVGSSGAIPTSVDCADMPVNGSNSAGDTIATFTQAGTYVITATLSDPEGLTATSSVTVNVLQSITVTPPAIALTLGQCQQFTAAPTDQFGNTIDTPNSYTWSIAAGGVGSINANGNYSAGQTAGSATVVATSGTFSGTASVSVVDLAPTAPTGLTATAGDSQAFLSWAAVVGASTYDVIRSTTSGGPYTTVNTSAVTTTWYTDTGLTDGTTYYYVVTAINSYGASGYSNEASATPLAVPAAATGLVATPENGAVSLAWSGVADNATGYNVKRATVNGGPYTIVNAGVVTGTTYTDSSLINGDTYYYVVSAVDGTLVGHNSNQAGATPGTPGVSQFPAGVVAWYQANTIPGATNGEPIYLWNDSSGNGYDATQSQSLP